jgi:hypothetical protein
VGGSGFIVALLATVKRCRVRHLARSRAAGTILHFVIAGHSRSKNGVASLAYAGNPC